MQVSVVWPWQSQNTILKSHLHLGIVCNLSHGASHSSRKSNWSQERNASEYSGTTEVAKMLGRDPFGTGAAMSLGADSMDSV